MTDAVREICRTPRTCLRELVPADAPFLRALLNEPAFLRFIGDRGVRTDAEAEEFSATRYRAAYREHGYGLWLVERLSDGVALGICGFVRREALPHADIGFAFLHEHEGQGYAREAASATLQHGRTALGLTQVLAIVHPENARSIALLEWLGFRPSTTIRMPEAAQPVLVFETG